MKLRTYQTLWGWEGTIEDAAKVAEEDGFDGLEGPMKAGWQEVLGDADYIGEVVTGGGYVPPKRRGVEDHLEDLRIGVEACLVSAPRMINVLGGCDWWSFSEKVRFGEALLALEDELRVPLSLETHRSRMTFHPWVTRDLLAELPELGITCDFSHWCCVTERLIMDEEPALLALLAGHCRHVHARVGYDQGPQVPDPSAQIFEGEVAAHLRWWRVLYEKAEARGQHNFTMTPEFGPDGYQQSDPVTGEVAASLQALNKGMRDRLGAEFGASKSHLV